MDIQPYKSMVHALARRAHLKSRTFEYDELYHYGIIGLLAAHNTFDPARGVLFSSYAYYRIHGAIIDGIRSMGYLKRGPRNGEETPVHVTLPKSLVANDDVDQLDRTIAQDLLDKTRAALKLLPRGDRNVLNLHYFHDLDLQQTGIKLGIKKSWTSRRHAKAVKKLSNMLRSAE